MEKKNIESKQHVYGLQIRQHSFPRTYISTVFSSNRANVLCFLSSFPLFLPTPPPTPLSAVEKKSLG
jgi:hypothetical protein